MKTFLVTFAAFVIVMTTSLRPTFGQESDLNNWYKADFTGILEGIKAYDISYYKDVEIYDGGIVYLKILVLPTSHGKANFYSIGLPSYSTYAAYLTYYVNITVDKYMLCSKKYLDDDGTMSKITTYPILASSFISPDLGSVGDCYVKLAKKLHNQQKGY